jgi:hypothetical protein
VRLPTISLHGEQVAPRRSLVANGLTYYRLRTAVASGRWQEPLPGVFVGHTGTLTQRERWLAAVYYGGPEAVLSHRSALAAWGSRVQELRRFGRAGGVRGAFVVPEGGGLVEVTAPHGHHLVSRAFVVVHQTRRTPSAVVVNGIPLSAPARAALDAAGTAHRRADAVHAISDVLQRNLCSVAELEEEARLLGRRIAPWARQALSEARRGMRSVGESDLRRAVLLAGLPEPEWGAAIETPAGTYFLDAYWKKHRVGAEADGAEFHLSADDWSRDLRRQNAIQGTGVTLFRFPVPRLRSEPMSCGLELAGVLL